MRDMGWGGVGAENAPDGLQDDPKVRHAWMLADAIVSAAPGRDAPTVLAVVGALLGEEVLRRSLSLHYAGAGSGGQRPETEDSFLTAMAWLELCPPGDPVHIETVDLLGSGVLSAIMMSADLATIGEKAPRPKKRGDYLLLARDARAAAFASLEQAGVARGEWIDVMTLAATVIANSARGAIPQATVFRMISDAMAFTARFVPLP